MEYVIISIEALSVGLFGALAVILYYAPLVSGQDKEA